MSDSWYRKRLHLPPYEDYLGQLWTLDGVCLNPTELEPSFLDEWPEDLRSTVFQAALGMELVDQYWEHLIAGYQRP